MSKNKNQIIAITTTKGRNYLAKLMVNTPVHYEKMMVGDGLLGEQNPLDLIDLISPKIELPISSVLFEQTGIALVTGELNNSEITEGFYKRELGLFVTDPDEGLILFSYIYIEDGGFIYPGDSNIAIQKRERIISIVDNATDVTANISSGLSVSHEELKIELEKYLLKNELLQIGDGIPLVTNGTIAKAQPGIDYVVPIDLDEKLSNKLDGKTYYGDLNLFISPSGNDETGDGTETNPYKTLDFVFDKLSQAQIIGGVAVVNLADGEYKLFKDNYNFPLLHSLKIIGNTLDKSKVTISPATERYIVFVIFIHGLFYAEHITFKQKKASNNYNVHCRQGGFVVSSCNFVGGGTMCHSASLNMVDCNYDDCYRAITAGAGGHVNAYRLTGQNNDYGLVSIGGILMYRVSTLAATVPTQIQDSGTINPPSQV